MPKKIGHNYSRDPYPWDDSEKPASATEWSCCGMKLSRSFYVCPICEKERDPESGGDTVVAVGSGVE